LDPPRHLKSQLSCWQLRGALVARAAALGPGAGASRAEIATLATRGIDALDGYFGQYLPQLVLAVISGRTLAVMQVSGGSHSIALAIRARAA